MANNPFATHKLFTSRHNYPTETFVGDAGRMFYNEATGCLRLSDGITPGGLPICGGGGGTITGNLTLIGDISAFGNISSNIVTTLATVNSNTGSFGNAAYIPTITVNEKGLITGVTVSPVSSISSSIILDGDVTASGYTGSNVAVTLNNINANVGTFGSSIEIPTFTVNAKGLITYASNIGIAVPSANITLVGDATGTGVTGGNTTVIFNTVNANVGTFGSNVSIPVITVNAKGLVTAIQTTTATAGDVFYDMKEPTGFLNRNSSLISFNNGTQTFTIIPEISNYTYYIRGTKHVISASKSIVLPNSTAAYYIYFDSSENLQYQTTFTDSILTDNAYVAIIYWNATQSQSNYFADERHGITMDGITHQYLHTTRGTVWLSGLGLTNLVVDGNGNTDDQAECAVQNGSIRDEDLRHDIYDAGGGVNNYDLVQELDPIAQLPVFYRLGTGNTWYVKTPDNFPMIYNGTAGYTGTLPPYNQYTGGAWQLTPLANNRYFCIHIFATNNVTYPVVALQGIASYQNQPKSQDALSEIAHLTGLPFAEFVPIATLIFNVANSNGNTPKAHFVSTDLGNSYIDWRTIGTFSSISNNNAVNQLNDLTDVVITTPTNSQFLTYNSNISQWVNSNVSVPSGNIILDGDVSAIGITGSNTTVTLNTVNANVGTFGNTITVPQITVNSKGLITAVNDVSIAYPINVLYDELAVLPIAPAAMGNNSIALGSGAVTSVAATNSLAIGEQSLARLPGGVVQASGRFGTSGDAQAGRYLLRTVTVNNTLTQAFIDGTGGTQGLVLPDNSTWTFTATVTGHRIDATGGHAGYKIEGIIYRDSGVATTALQGNIIKNVISESNPVWDVTVTADATFGSLSVKVKGENSKIIRWLALIETVEITN